MHALLDFLVYLFLPPVGLAITALIGVLLSLRWRRLGRAVALVSLVGLILLGMPVTAQILLFRLAELVPAATRAGSPPQAIVVLGGDVARSLPPGEAFDVGPLSLDRVRTAARLHRQTGLPILVTGGPVSPAGEPVADVMAVALLQDFNTQVTWQDTSARNTWENASASAALLRSRGISSVYVVTQEWHMPRAMIAFRHVGLHVVPAPTQLLGPPPLDDWRFYVPRESAWNDSYYAIHEWIGYFYYAFAL